MIRLKWKNQRANWDISKTLKAYGVPDKYLEASTGLNSSVFHMHTPHLFEIPTLEETLKHIKTVAKHKNAVIGLNATAQAIMFSQYGVSTIRSWINAVSEADWRWDSDDDYVHHLAAGEWEEVETMLEMRKKL